MTITNIAIQGNLVEFKTQEDGLIYGKICRGYNPNTYTDEFFVKVNFRLTPQQRQLYTSVSHRGANGIWPWCRTLDELESYLKSLAESSNIYLHIP